MHSSRGDKVYSIELQGCLPKCSCDWMENELPCKHIFLVLNTFDLTWHDLPEVFRFVFVPRRMCHFQHLLAICNTFHLGLAI